MRMRKRLPLDGVYGRRLAQLVACHAPAGFVRWAPPLVGVAIAIAAPRARRRIARELERARGRVGEGATPSTSPVRSRISRCASRRSSRRVEGRSGANKPWCLPIHGSKASLLRDAASSSRRHTRRDGKAWARSWRGRHNRVAAGMSARAVTLFGRPGVIPEGPLRLAQLADVLANSSRRIQLSGSRSTVITESRLPAHRNVHHPVNNRMSSERPSAGKWDPRADHGQAAILPRHIP
jgi:hypothetical protein